MSTIPEPLASEESIDCGTTEDTKNTEAGKHAGAIGRIGFGGVAVRGTRTNGELGVRDVLRMFLAGVSALLFLLVPRGGVAQLKQRLASLPPWPK